MGKRLRTIPRRDAEYYQMYRELHPARRERDRALRSTMHQSLMELVRMFPNEHKEILDRLRREAGIEAHPAGRGRPVGTQGMTGENLGEITISLILGETTNAQRRSAQCVVFDHSVDIAEAKKFLTALGLLGRFPDE